MPMIIDHTDKKGSSLTFARKAEKHTKSMIPGVILVAGVGLERPTRVVSRFASEAKPCSQSLALWLHRS